MSTCRKIKESDVSNALETRSAAWTASDNNRLQLQFIYLLRAVIVVSQIPALRLWPSTRDAIVYIIIVAVLELITSNVWQYVAERLTHFGNPARRVFVRLARYPNIRTVGKLICLFVLYIVSAIPIGWIAGATAASVMSSIGANLWHLLLLSIYLCWTFGVVRLTILFKSPTKTHIVSREYLGQFIFKNRDQTIKPNPVVTGTTMTSLHSILTFRPLLRDY